jgi:hypothetical protein
VLAPRVLLYTNPTTTKIQAFNRIDVTPHLLSCPGSREQDNQYHFESVERENHHSASKIYRAASLVVNCCPRHREIRAAATAQRNDAIVLLGELGQVHLETKI